VVILALANLGTSFASAILAKDTTTANGELVDINTNEVVATGQAAQVYTGGECDGEMQGNYALLMMLLARQTFVMWLQGMGLHPCRRQMPLRC
jgi:hypothetical protein